MLARPQTSLGLRRNAWAAKAKGEERPAIPDTSKGLWHALTTDTWSPVWIGNWKLWPGKHQWLENLPLVENPSFLDGNPQSIQSIWIDLWWNSPTSWDCDNKLMIIGNSKKSWMMMMIGNHQEFPRISCIMIIPNLLDIKEKKRFCLTRDNSLHSYEKGALRLENSKTVSAVRAWCHPQPTRRPGREEVVFGRSGNPLKIHGWNDDEMMMLKKNGAIFLDGFFCQFFKSPSQKCLMVFPK